MNTKNNKEEKKNKIPKNNLEEQKKGGSCAKIIRKEKINKIETKYIFKVSPACVRQKNKNKVSSTAKQ